MSKILDCLLKRQLAFTSAFLGLLQAMSNYKWVGIYQICSKKYIEILSQLLTNWVHFRRFLGILDMCKFNTILDGHPLA